MTKLKVAFRNYANAPKPISLKVNWLPPGTEKKRCCWTCHARGRHANSRRRVLFLDTTTNWLNYDSLVRNMDSNCARKAPASDPEYVSTQIFHGFPRLSK